MNVMYDEPKLSLKLYIIIRTDNIKLWTTGKHTQRYLIRIIDKKNMNGILTLPKVPKATTGIWFPSFNSIVGARLAVATCSFNYS